MSTDILVIGGGIAGVSVAARLAPHARVTLLEAEDALGYHASGRSAALFEEAYGKPQVKALNRASAEYHRTANGGYLSPRGFLLVGRDQEADQFRADMSEMDIDQIAASEARAMVPILNETVTFAAYHEGAMDLDTDRMIQDFARDIRQNGGAVIPGAPVSAITRIGQGWEVQSGERAWRAATLVNAAGAWADRIAAMAGVAPIGITPMRRSMACIPAPGGLDVNRWPMVLGAGETWYAKPQSGRLLVSPGDEDPVEPHDAWADDMVLAEGLDRYQQHVTEPVTRVLSTWAGLRSFAPDRLLVLGRDPDCAEFAWSAGQGGYGFQTAPAASALAAALILGHPPELDADLVAALSPDRLR